MLACGRAQEASALAGHLGEIGVSVGRSLFLLYLMSRPDEHTVGVDTFLPRARVPTDKYAARIAAFRRARVRMTAGDPRLRILERDSADLTASDLTEAAGGRFRILHVDGNHEPPFVRHDLQIASDALIAGGALIVDDVFEEKHTGVISGLVAFLADNRDRGLVPFAVGGGKVYLTVRDTAGPYREALAAMRAPYVASGELFGEQIVRFAFEPWDDLIPGWLLRRVRGWWPLRRLRRAAWDRLGYPPLKFE